MPFRWNYEAWNVEASHESRDLEHCVLVGLIFFYQSTVKAIFHVHSANLWVLYGMFK